MRNVCWALFGFSVLLFLCGVYSKISGPEGHLFSFQPVAWWRAAMAAVIYVIALRLLDAEVSVRT